MALYFNQVIMKHKSKDQLEPNKIFGMDSVECDV